MKTINLNQVDFTELENAICKNLGYDVKFDISIALTRTNDEYLKVESQNLAEHTGIMKNQYEYFKLSNFGGGVVGGEDNKQYCLPLSWAFQYKHGGSNGVSFLTAWFIFETKKWTISFNNI